MCSQTCNSDAQHKILGRRLLFIYSLYVCTLYSVYIIELVYKVHQTHSCHAVICEDIHYLNAIIHEEKSLNVEIDISVNNTLELVY